jgi:hypothetical protein
MTWAKKIGEFTNEIWESDEEQIVLAKWAEERIKQLSPGITDLEINDSLEDVVYRIKARLKKQIELYKVKGLRPIYDFDPFLDDVLIHSEEVSSRRLRESKLSIKSMDWGKFEDLCIQVLANNGIDKVGVTRRVKEGGIDFYGVLVMGKYTSGALLKDLEVRILGQARHHSGKLKVSPDELKVLKEDCANFKAGRGVAIKVIPEWFVEINSPLVPMFITNTGFTKGAYVYASQEGILIKNGDQIAQDLLVPPSYYKKT